MTKNNDRFIHHLFSIIAGTLITLSSATIVTNFGWTAKISIISYLLTFMVYFVIFLLWKEN